MSVPSEQQLCSADRNSAGATNELHPLASVLLLEWKLKVVASSVSMVRLGVVPLFDDGCCFGHVLGVIYIVVNASWTTSCSGLGGSCCSLIDS